MMRLAFRQVDVFASAPLQGNPLAVVLGADGLDTAAMAAFARWTNLSETTFVLRPEPGTPQPGVPGSAYAGSADYRLRIFTPERELPFAGHPTLGSCHAWLAAGGVPRGAEVVQGCDAGLVRIRREGTRLAFAAPPLLRTGAVEDELLARLVRGLGLSADDVVASQWVDNGPGWVAVLLRSRAAVLAVRPDPALLDGLPVGVVGPWEPELDGTEAQFEVRAFLPGASVAEDPVTGSLNASLAQWLIGSGRAPAAYVASQGTALGRAGRVHVRREGDDVWVGGEVVTVVEGWVSI